MSLLAIVATLLVGGVILWLANAFLPVSAKVKQVVNIAIAIAVILWLLIGFGIPGQTGISAGR